LLRCRKPRSCVFVGVDTSNLYRKEAETLADRTMVPIPNLPDCDHAVCPGLVISSVVLLPTQPGQGTWVLDTRRVTSQDLATGGAARQLHEVVFLLVKKGLRPIIIGDRWDACAPFLKGMAEVCASCRMPRQTQSRLLSPCSPEPARSAWGQEPRWSALPMLR
jgi:hypothetical protein